MESTVPSPLSRFLRDPLLHFALLGVGLAAAHTLWREDASARESPERIAVTTAEVDWLRTNWEARWRRPPTETELRGLVDEWVRQEVLYREALAMGLDRGDEVVRRRLVQMLELLTEDLAAQVQPTEAELTAHLAENRTAYRIPERRDFAHVYFNTDRRGDAATIAAAELLAELRRDPDVSLTELGDRLLLESEFRAQSPTDVERLFGQRFADAVFALEPGAWHGSIASSYGLHLVRVTGLREGRDPELAEVRDDVLRDYTVVVKERAREATYVGLAQRYEIEIDEAAIRAGALTEGPPGEGVRSESR